MKTIFKCVLFLFLTSCIGITGTADLVLLGGKVYTLDSENSIIQAVAMKDGKILAVGSDEKISSYIVENSTVIELGGKTVTPGFIDSHGHLFYTGSALLSVDLSYVANYEVLVAKVAESVKNVEPGQWVIGTGWHQEKWEPPPEVMVSGFPTHDLLSAASPDNPVFLNHASGHAALVNAKAMEIAGVDENTEPPEGGTIIKDADGQPTGIFTENAMNLLRPFLPSGSESMSDAMEAALTQCVRNGITSFHDASINRPMLDALKGLRNQGELKVRVYAMLSVGSGGGDPELVEEYFAAGPDTDPFITVRTIKMFSDGALGSRGAWLLSDYSDDPGNTGQNTTPMETIAQWAGQAAAAGFQTAVHAIGDRANREVLNVFEETAQQYPDMDHRFRIEHAQHLSAQDIPRFGELGVIASMQAIHMASDISWAINRLGPERIQEGAYVWQKLMQSGALVTNGTDTPVEPVDPITNFYAAVTRRTRDGELFAWSHPEEAFSRREALKAYTQNPAYASFNEDKLGSIEPGKLADLTVFSQDLLTVPENEIRDTEVEYTIVNGEVVYQK